MHHYVGATTMLIESGAEMRGRMKREPVQPGSFKVLLCLLLGLAIVHGAKQTLSLNSTCQPVSAVWLLGPQLKWPYALIAETETLLSAKARMFNIYLISTAGVAPEDINRCLQCAPRALSQALLWCCFELCM
jgi:hypothetical protein